LQAMELGVRLNLLCSRVDEVLPGLQDFLDPFLAALAQGGAATTLFMRSFEPALELAGTAHTAQQEAEAAQVWF
jgi:hypothetical protein